MTRPVVTVIGLMGAGKTKVGRRAADALRRPFVDTDRIVERAARMTVADIFAVEGEQAFRARERAAIDEALTREGAVVSVGGGAVLDPHNVARMRAAGDVVWLYAEPETLAARLRNSMLRGDRPLLAGTEPVAALRDLLDRRRPAYAAAATVTLTTDGMEVDESACLLADWIREHT